MTVELDRLHQGAGPVLQAFIETAFNASIM